MRVGQSIGRERTEKRDREVFPMHLIKCLFLLQQICQLNAARIGKTRTENREKQSELET